MSATFTIFDVLPEPLIHPARREEAIAVIAALEHPAATRRQLYYAWCGATMSTIRGEDLARVAPKPEPVKASLPLFPRGPARHE